MSYSALPSRNQRTGAAIGALCCVLFGALANGVSHAATATVPGTHSTIAAAVTAVQGTPGALVTINSNGPFVENVVATQSVDIVAGTGFTPVIRAAAGSGVDSNIAISIKPNTTTTQTFNLTGLRVEGSGTNSSTGVYLIASNSGDVNLNINQLNIISAIGWTGFTALNIRSDTFGATGNKVVVVNNTTFTVNTAANSGANAIFMAEGGDLSVASSVINTTGGVSAIDLRGNPRPINFSLRDSTLNIAAPAGPYSAITTDLIDDVSSTIVRNTFNFIGDPQGSVSGLLIRYLTNGRSHTITQNNFIGTTLRAGSAVSMIPFKSSATAPAQSVTGIITNNVMRNVELGIQANPQQPGDTANLIVINNTVDSSNGCLSLSANDGTIINGRFNNNLCTNIAGAIVPPGQGPGYTVGAITTFAGTGANIAMTFANNGFFNNPNGNYSPTVPSIASVGAVFNANPRYANPAAGDLRLSFGSPAIDTGLTEATVTVDHNDNARPQAAAYDIGAFEGGVQGLPEIAAMVPTLGDFAIGFLVLLLGIGAAGGFTRTRK
jgi:hypothetical protein